MIRIISLNGPLAQGQSPEELRARIEPHRRGGIDLFCCQSVRCVDGEPARTGMDAGAVASRRLSDALGLTCSCFVAGRSQGGSAGLAILTGTGVWMLNSGSFAVGQDDGETVVQFGLVRKNGASVLALNLHLADSPQAQTRQLAELFVHPLLKDPYGAVAICADRPARISLKEWQALAAPSRYAPQRGLLSSAESGLLCLLTARTGAVSVVTVRQDQLHPGNVAAASEAPALSVAFDIQRMVQDKHARPYFPLSFREQWLGYKEHRAFA
jgi:hypothetical protein